MSEAVSTPLTIQLAYQGSAQQGADYTVPSGNIVVPAGQTSEEVEIPTVTNNTVESDRVLDVSLAQSSALSDRHSEQHTGDRSPRQWSRCSPSRPLRRPIPQGGAASFTITANQAPAKNTSVSFAVEGTAQPGQNYVPLAGAALLPAGQTQVTVVLQSIQTNIEFEPTDMIVGHWPTRVGQVNVKAGETVEPGEAILTLTEPNLSVTLQASAADRSELSVGQPCTVQISGENNQGTGVITELDNDPTEVSSGAGQSSQVYEGKIEVSDLTGADGSQVSINVVDPGSQQRAHRSDRRRQAGRIRHRRGPGGRSHQGRQDHRGPGENRAHRGLLHPDYRWPEDRTAGDRGSLDVTVAPTMEETPPGGTPEVKTLPLLELESVSRVYGEEIQVYAFATCPCGYFPATSCPLWGHRDRGSPPCSACSASSIYPLQESSVSPGRM